MSQSRSGRLAEHVEHALREDGRRIVITGSGGWLGMATLDLLSAALGDDLPERIACFGSSRRTLQFANGLSVEQRPLVDIALLKRTPSLVLHLAFLTKERADSMDEDEYRKSNRALSGAVLDALDGVGADAVFVASSGAAAVADDDAASPAMRLYGALKRQDEVEFGAWAENRQRKAVIARIFNLSGPHINKHQSYALASFILDALAGGPINVRASRPVIRGYVAIRELMSLVFSLLMGKQTGVIRFDTGGEAMEMSAIAQAVVDALGPAPVQRPTVADLPPDRYVGDDRAYRQLLAQHGIAPVPFIQQVSETSEYLARK